MHLKGSAIGDYLLCYGILAELWIPKGYLHAMDCTDIVIGTARGEYSRVRDYYSRDR